MLRIAFDSRDALAPEPRGWSRYARDLLDALRSNNDVEVLEMTGGGPEFIWEQVGLPRRLRAAAPDVVHAPSCFLPLWRPCAGVVTIHDLAFEVFPADFAPKTRAKFKLLTPRAARSAERIVTVSAFTRDDVCSRYGVDPAKVDVVHNAPSLPIGDGSGDVPAGPYLLGVGDLRAKKNWGRLVDAWLALRADGLPHRLVIAGGDGGEAAALRERAGAGSGDGLELPGYVDDARLDALMRGADVLVHPSLYEGFGLVVAEAMARGVPVAAARGTALPEAGGDAAVYFDPLSVDEIAAAVGEALRRRSELAELGLARAAELSWERSAAQTVSSYRAAVAAR